MHAGQLLEQLVLGEGTVVPLHLEAGVTERERGVVVDRLEQQRSHVWCPPGALSDPRPGLVVAGQIYLPSHAGPRSQGPHRVGGRLEAMSETPSDQMPDAPWWSSPGATAVLPPVESPPAPPPIAPSRSPRRAGTAGLLALALVLGGAVGGGVATLVGDNGKTTVSGTTALDTRSLGSIVKGTPEAAAAVIAPSVVTVEVTGQVGSPFGGVQSQSDTGSGI